ncbi:hypothetical protein QWI17_11750 [Gilvimarinus sp. SDUM040013]|uniref:Transcriptional regulator SutA RNAP-binding domain-containing protein n=1 Tax=Gilvimarinus gilvus TaxID=3058038 RepID=A0ABU4RW33_9GAMM|nr:hypothetical protein [Gilvimarinus sp. SDUM040013]MDO3386509.1 hypothetical protein [Gilvimarinus sp. SDUM040013]MDX6849085.1 hypothetical protein [Gilvimarinus sp. SDUM040013]
MKPVKSKKEQRQELEAQIRDYQDRGGTVYEVPRGISGREDTNTPLPHVFDKKADPDTRTPVNEVIAAIEERKKPKAPPKRPRHGASKSRKKIIYDEFGEPLRWEWVD